MSGGKARGKRGEIERKGERRRGKGGQGEGKGEIHVEEGRKWRRGDGKGQGKAEKERKGEGEKQDSRETNKNTTPQIIWEIGNHSLRYIMKVKVDVSTSINTYSTTTSLLKDPRPKPQQKVSSNTHWVHSRI